MKNDCLKILLASKAMSPMATVAKTTSAADMPTTELTESQLTDGRIGILDLMLACKLAPTKSEARRLVQQGGVFADDEKVASIDVVFTGEQLKNGVKLRKGKKVFHKAVLAC